MSNKIILFLAFVLFFLPASLLCQTSFPEKTWKDAPNPLTGSDAVNGGTISVFSGQYPKSLNYYLDNNVLSAEIFGAMFETLLTMNPVSLAYEPGLASSWIISDDKKEFTFKINVNAKWSDGSPITAHDVIFTYDVVMDEKNLTGAHKIDMERFYPPVVVNAHTIIFKAKDVHWKNLGAAGGFHILSKKALKGKDFNKVNFSFPLVSGPYKIGKINEGIYIALEQRKDWWNRKAKRFKGTGNFKTIKFMFFAERENAFEAFKKRKIDIFPIYTSRIWINETKGESFLKNWIIKQKIFNKKPVGFQGFAMNMRKPPFDELKVREAMAYLLDRRKMNSALMYDQYFLHRSYYEDLYSKESPCTNHLFELNKEKARILLKEAGWDVNPETGFLEKNNKRFSFRFLTRSAASEKFISIYAEDLKDVGIELVIDKKDWASWARDMDEFNYQMTWAAWGAGIFKDPEGMWSSKEAVRNGGNNITGFENSHVDQLIEKQKVIFDINKRNNICRKIDEIVYKQMPYILLWNINYVRLLYWNKFGTPDTVLSKYGDERSAIWYWWIDQDSVADLNDAVQYKTFLPSKSPSIYFEDTFRK